MRRREGEIWFEMTTTPFPPTSSFITKSLVVSKHFWDWDYCSHRKMFKHLSWSWSWSCSWCSCCRPCPSRPQAAFSLWGASSWVTSLVFLQISSHCSWNFSCIVYLFVALHCIVFCCMSFVRCVNYSGMGCRYSERLLWHYGVAQNGNWEKLWCMVTSRASDRES